MHPYALLALLALPTVLDTPRYSPAPGVALRKSFEWKTELSLLEMSSTMGGQPVPEQYLPELEVEVANTSRLVVVDELEGVDDGRPTRLVRTYEEIAAALDEEVRMNGQDAGSREAEGESELEGAQVAFVWDADAGEYGASFVDERAPTELLAGLHEDLDLRAFLPPADWSRGAWEIDAAAIRALLEPGGELGVTGVEEEGEPFEERSFEAEVSATLGSAREEDGRTLLVIELEGQAGGTSDRPTDLSFVPVVDGTATETRTSRFELEGWITWDPAAGRAHSCELTLAVKVQQAIVKDPGQDGPEFDTTTVLFGDWTFRATIEPAE